MRRIKDEPLALTTFRTLQCDSVLIGMAGAKWIKTRLVISLYMGQREIFLSNVCKLCTAVSLDEI